MVIHNSCENLFLLIYFYLSWVIFLHTNFKPKIILPEFYPRYDTQILRSRIDLNIDFRAFKTSFKSHTKEKY